MALGSPRCLYRLYIQFYGPSQTLIYSRIHAMVMDCTCREAIYSLMINARMHAFRHRQRHACIQAQIEACMQRNTCTVVRCSLRDLARSATPTQLAILCSLHVGLSKSRSLCQPVLGQVTRPANCFQLTAGTSRLMMNKQAQVPSKHASCRTSCMSVTCSLLEPERERETETESICFT